MARPGSRLGAKDSRTGNPWDSAHDLVGRGGAFAAAGGPEIMAVEPDVVQGWDYRDGTGDRGMAASAAPVCAFDDQEPGRAGRRSLPGVVAWNAGAAFSQFAAARAKVGAKQGKITDRPSRYRLRPGASHPAGRTVSAHLQRNFVDGGPARTMPPTGRRPASLISNRGHGTGTLSLLAGNKLDGTSPGWPGFADFVGGAPLAQDHPGAHRRLGGALHHQHHGAGLRLCPRQKGAHVLSMSMGGLSSQRAGRRRQPRL